MPTHRKKLPAGVAFLTNLKVTIGLKSMCEISVLSKSYFHVRRKSSVSSRGCHSQRRPSYPPTEIGTGYSNANEGYPIYMDIGPFSRLLVMEQLV